MSRVEPGSYDLFLEHSGVKVGYVLAQGADGAPAWREGLAPSLLPAVRQDAFSYGHVPPNISVAIPFEGFSGGAGVRESDETTLYNVASGVDTSWGFPMLAAARQPMAGLPVAPVKFYRSSFGAFALTGPVVFQWDVGDQGWVQRSAGGLADYTDIVEMSGVLYAARGPDAAYDYSENGGRTWAESESDRRFLYFAVRGTAEGEAVLWGVEEGGAVSNTTDGRDGGVEWSASDQIGHASETVSAFLQANDALFVMKEEGFFRYDGATQGHLYEAVYRTTGNGSPTLYSRDGSVYTVYGGALLRYDPLGDTAFSAVWPTNGMRGNAEVAGDITALAEDREALYAAAKGPGHTYIWKYVGGVWHIVADFGPRDCLAMQVFGAGEIHPTNPVLACGYGEGAVYFIQPRHGLDPASDEHCRFEAEGMLVGSWHTVGAQAFDKRLNGTRAIVRGASAAQSVAIAAELDESATPMVQLRATADGVNTSRVGEAEIVFRRIRFVDTFRAGHSRVTPVLLSQVWDVTPSPPRRRQWVIDVLSGGGTRFGAPSTFGPTEQERHLFRAAGRHATLYREERSFAVEILDVQGQRDADDKGVFQVTLAEISELTETTGILVWNEGAWNSGRVWAPGEATPPPPVPGAPTGVTATAGVSDVTLAWDDPGDSTVTKYQVRYRREGDAWFRWTNIEPGATSYTVTELVPGTRYVFALRAVNRSGAGAPAEEGVTVPDSS